MLSPVDRLRKLVSYQLMCNLPPCDTKLMDGTKTKLLLVAAFLGVVLFYAVKSVQKFNENKITTSTHREAEGGGVIAFPSVTICSGFRDGRYRNYYAKANCATMEVRIDSRAEQLRISQLSHFKKIV